MTTFAAGSSTSITLGEYDAITVNGSAKLTITPGPRPAYETKNVGSLTYGPYGSITTMTLAAISDGTYTTGTSKVHVPVVMVDLSAAEIASPTAEQLAATSVLYQLNTPPHSVYQSNGTALVAIGGAGGGDTSTNTSTSVDGQVALFNGAGGKTLRPSTASGYTKLTAGVQSVVTAIPPTDIDVLTGIDTATKSAVTGSDNVLTAIGKLQATKLDGLDSVTIGSGTTAITHAGHSNRLVVVNQAGATTGTFSGTGTSGAVASDIFYLRNVGTGTFTASGAITARSGYRLTAGPGEDFSADYIAATDAYDSTSINPGALGGSVTVSATAPSSPSNGQGWFDLRSGRELRWINDGTSSQWVET